MSIKIKSVAVIPVPRKAEYALADHKRTLKALRLWGSVDVWYLSNGPRSARSLAFVHWGMGKHSGTYITTTAQALEGFPLARQKQISWYLDHRCKASRVVEILCSRGCFSQWIVLGL